MGTMITHQGKIIKITDDAVTVAITPEADECSGCAVGLLCGKQERLEVTVGRAGDFSVGQTVTVGMKVGVQRKGTVLFFVMPVVVLLLALFASLGAGATEGLSALISLLAVGAWYGILYLSRVRLRSQAQVVILRHSSTDHL